MDQINRRRLEKRDKILLAAKACFIRKGFHQTSMQDICLEADMSAGNLYRYFDNKEAIIDASAEVELKWMTTAIQELPSTENMVQAIHDTVIWTASTLISDGEAEITAELFAEAGRNPRINAIYTRFNQQLVDEICLALQIIEAGGVIKTSHDHKTIAMALVSLVDGLVMHKIVNPNLDLLKMRPAIETMINSLLGTPE